MKSIQFKRCPTLYKALPSGLSLSPRVFTKVVEAALVLLREAGIHVLNYLDDWLILAQSRALLCEHRDTVLSHLSRLGLQVSWEKSTLSPMQKISLVGLSQPHSTSLSRACSVDAELPGVFPRKRAVPLKHFQRLLGHMASTAAVTPLGLLHMRPLQRWLHSRVPRWAWQHGTYRVSGTPSCCHTFSPWSDLAFLQAGVPLAQVSRHVVVSTDASTTGWGAMCNGHAAAGLWTGPQLKVQGSLLFVTYTIIQSIISSEMQVELKKNTALHEESEEKKITPRLCSLGSTV